MNIQDFLSKLDGSHYSDDTNARIRTILEGANELTLDLRAKVLEVMQEEIDRDFGPIDLGAEGERLEAELSEKLESIEEEAQADIEAVEREMQSLADLCQKVDVLDRLHAQQS